jgi:hypothetical protein
VPGELRGEVHVVEHVAVEDEQAILEQPFVEGQADRARRAERLVLDHVPQPHPPVDVAEDLAHAVGHEAAGEDHLVHAVGAEPIQHEGQERPARERHHGLGRGERERPQPRPLAARQDERLHVSGRCLRR